MGILWGLVIAALGLLAWGGQTFSLFAPETAARLSITESQEDVDPVFWADVRGEAMWDVFTLWTLFVAGLLLMFDAAAWPYFGLVGGGIYVYYSGRGVLARRQMQRRGMRIGSSADVKSAFVMLPVWGVAGAVTIVAAVVALD